METPAFTCALARVAPDVRIDRRVEAGQHRAEFHEQRQRRDAAIGDAERAETCLLVQRAGGRVGVGDGQHQLLEAGFAPCLADQVGEQRRARAAPAMLGRHVHGHDSGLVRIDARLVQEADGADEVAAGEGSPRVAFRVRGQSVLGGGERLHRLFLVAGREGVGVLAQRAQPQRAIRNRVGGDEAPHSHFQMISK